MAGYIEDNTLLSEYFMIILCLFALINMFAVTYRVMEKEKAMFRELIVLVIVSESKVT